MSRQTKNQSSSKLSPQQKAAITRAANRAKREAAKQPVDNRSAGQKGLIPAEAVDNRSAGQKGLIPAEAAQSQVSKYYALMHTPAGQKLYNYTVAVLELLNAIDSSKPIAEQSTFYTADLAKFYKTRTVLDHHTANGNIEPGEKGKARLSLAGYLWFTGRVNGQNTAQRATREEVDRVKSAIQSGKFEGKGLFPKDTAMRPITLIK